MPRKSHRWLIAAAALGSAAAALASSEAAAPAPALLFGIETASGDTIGWQRETASPADGTTAERQIAMRVHGHGVQREYQRLERRPDGSVQLRRGASPATARTAREETGDTIIPLSDVVAAAQGESRPGLTALGTMPGGEIVIEHRANGQFQAAWLVTPDGHGGAARIRQPMLGGDWIFRLLAGRDAPPPAGAVANLPHPMVDAPYAVSRSAQQGHIRYFTANPSGAGLPLPETGEQRVTPRGDGLWQIDVCPDCGPGMASDAAALARASQPTRWLQADAPELVAAARQARKGAASQAEIMQRLSRIARKRLKDVDYTGHYSARAAWQRRRGDCTEDAVLLAALARAAGIPARVVSGLAYERSAYHGTANAFFPHAWTIAYTDGTWRSFDIATGGFTAAHIALAISDGEPARIMAGWRLAALIDWQDMAEVRRPVRPLSQAQPVR